MLLPVVAEQLVHLVRRPPPPPPVAKRLAGPGAEGGAPESGLRPTSPPAQPVVEVPKGTRYQLFRALRAMANGQSMLVEHRIPTMSDHLDATFRRSELVRSLSKATSWQGHKDIEPVLVPGTAYPSVIGRILIRSGWCAPSPHPHWVPNLRFFFLTDLGHESFLKAQDWWSELTMLERMRLMLLE